MVQKTHSFSIFEPNQEFYMKKLVTLLAILTILSIALIDALDLFIEKPYLMIPHGSHNHYVPHDRDPNVATHEFPMEPPKEDERILPNGKVVKKSSLNN